MIRRFESYGFAADAPAAARADLARILRDTGRHIPEVRHSATGANRSATPIDLVWEHSYEQADDYARYMCHPFHVCVLDRYLLPESPECITEPRRGLALGLFGYETDDADFVAPAGVRRIVAFRADPDATAEAVADFVTALRHEPAEGALISVAAANTMGLVWYPDGWTHVWEQVFPDEPTMLAALPAEAARLSDGPVVDSIDLWYGIEPGPPPGSSPDAATAEIPAGPVLLVDTVTVPGSRVGEYLDGFTRLYLAGARRRGLELAACWQTPSGHGEDVTVTTALDVGSWATWEQARNAAVADPDVTEWIRLRRSLMTGGRRTFVTSSDL